MTEHDPMSCTYSSDLEMPQGWGPPSTGPPPTGPSMTGPPMTPPVNAPQPSDAGDDV